MNRLFHPLAAGPSVPRLGPRIDQEIRRMDHWRAGSFGSRTTGAHREWQHFCVHAEGVDLLINLSMAEDTRPAAQPGDWVHRLTLLARDDAWHGGVTTLHRAQIPSGSLQAQWEGGQLGYADGAYHLKLALPDQDIAVELQLRPRARPLLCTGVALGRHAPLDWLVLPDLEAHGQVRLNGRSTRVQGAPAYHDHNWGHFAWGGEFVWEWGYALGQGEDGPGHALVYVRMLDPGRHRSLAQALFVWHAGQVVRVFRDHELQVQTEGLLCTQRPLRVPRAAGLLVRGQASDVPQRLVVQARGDGDQVALVFRSTDFAQVVVPADAQDTRTAVIHEVAAQVQASGRVAGHPLRCAGPSFFEVVHA